LNTEFIQTVLMPQQAMRFYWSHTEYILIVWHPIGHTQALGAFNTEFIQTVLMPQQAMRFLVEINLQHAQQMQLAQVHSLCVASYWSH
jgi:hypothetical protein